MVFFTEGEADLIIDRNRVSELLDGMLGKLGRLNRVLILPPDITRFHSYAGEITSILHNKLKNSSYIEIMSTKGSNLLMSAEELEMMMGHISSPVRKVPDYMGEHFTDQLVTVGIYAGGDKAYYLQGTALCQEVNINLLDKGYKKVIAWLDPEEFKSTWVGNKTIFKTRMAVVDGGELIILCRGINTFGKDPERGRKYNAGRRKNFLCSLARPGSVGRNQKI